MVVVQAYLHGVLPVHKAVFVSLQQHTSRWSNRLRQAFAVCHSLNMVSKTLVAGMAVEHKLFKAVEAQFLVTSSFCIQWWDVQCVCMHCITCMSVCRIRCSASLSV